MRLNTHILFTAAVCAVLAGSLAAHADPSKQQKQEKAATAKTVTKTPIALTVVKSQATSVLAVKPPVATLVNPHPGSPVQLNTQPIPPGLGPVDPPR